jgi:CRISPR-associated exonuclease Cas4
MFNSVRLKMPNLVRISELSIYLRCPRQVYFQAMGHSVWEKTDRSYRLLLRELALYLSAMEPGTDIEIWLENSLRDAERELPIIYPGEIDLNDLRKAADELEMLIPEIKECYAPWLDKILPSKVEVDLRSERLGLTGRLDRLVEKDHLIPSIIKAGAPPNQGVWRSDRIRLAGYAILLEDALGDRIEEGLVEYPNAGVIRQVKIRSIDRSRVLRIRDRIRQINDGRLPDRPKNAPCDKCNLLKKCEVRRSLASKFF